MHVDALWHRQHLGSEAHQWLREAVCLTARNHPHAPAVDPPATSP